MQMKNVIVLIVLMFSLGSLAANADFKLDVYDRWAKIPKEKLMAMGKDFIMKENCQDSALLCFTIVANRYYDKSAKEADISYVVSALNNIGYMYIYVYADYEKAYYNLERAVDITEENNLKTPLTATYLNLANLQLINSEIRTDKKNVECTMSMYRKAFDSAVKGREWSIMMIVMSNMQNYVLANWNMINMDREMAIYSKLRIPDSVPLKSYVALMCKAMNSLKAGNAQLAVSQIKKADKHINTSLTPERYLMLDLSAVANIYVNIGKLDEAAASLIKAESLAKKYNAKDFLVSIYQELYNISKKKGDKAKSSEYELLYLRSRENLMNDNKLLNMSELRFQSELQKVNEQVKSLSEKRRQQQMLFYLALCIIVIVVLFSLLLYKKYRELKERNLMLYQKNVEILERENEELISQKVKKNTTSSSLLADDYKQAVLQRIRQVMNESDEIYQTEFSLSRLSELVDSKRSYVSTIINENYDSFYAMLNEARVKEACRRFNDTKNYGGLSIEAICMDLGFKSRSNFNNVFKRITGLTPSEYSRIARNKA